MGSDQSWYSSSSSVPCVRPSNSSCRRQRWDRERNWTGGFITTLSFQKMCRVIKMNRPFRPSTFPQFSVSCLVIMIINPFFKRLLLLFQVCRTEKIHLYTCPAIWQSLKSSQTVREAQLICSCLGIFIKLEAMFWWDLQANQGATVWRCAFI